MRLPCVNVKPRWYGLQYALESIVSARGPYSSPHQSLLLLYNQSHAIEDFPDDPGGLMDSTWKWVDNWTIQDSVRVMDDDPSSTEYIRATDPDGWFYALEWSFEYSPTKYLTSNVRRRRWERACRQKTALEFVDDLMDQNYTRQSLLRCCSGPNLDSNGIFDFHKV